MSEVSCGGSSMSASAQALGIDAKYAVRPASPLAALPMLAFSQSDLALQTKT